MKFFVTKHCICIFVIENCILFLEVVYTLDYFYSIVQYFIIISVTNPRHNQHYCVYLHHALYHT